MLEYPRWAGILAALFFVLVLYPIGADIWDRATREAPEPVSAWFEVASVNVTDAHVGQRHNVIVNRTINRDFAADWTVTVRRIWPNGEMEAVCARSSRNDYRAGTPTPEGKTLRWWMDVPPNEPCDPYAPGKYIVSMLWTLHLPDGDRDVRADSNIFNVLPVDERSLRR